MLPISLLTTPLIGMLIMLSKVQHYKNVESLLQNTPSVSEQYTKKDIYFLKSTALRASVLTLFISLFMFTLCDFSTNQFQFVQNEDNLSYFSIYMGVDGLSMYFILLTTIIMPVSLLSNWTSISDKTIPFLITILLLEVLLLSVFLVLDAFLYYVFFESILPPLFLLIGLFGSVNRVRASFYLFLYTLLGSLFMLLAILTMSSTMGFTDFDALYKTNFIYYTQLFLFVGIFIAFAVKTPTIFLNTWLLKAHVESPLSGSIILAGIVLKLSLYGVLRLILPLLPKAYIISTCLVFTIGVITIFYASISTIRTTDVKELIAYSSVCHAAVYLMAVFSNNIQGIEGAIILGLAHGFVSSGLFICVGGVLYDRSSTRLISYYRGMAQVMPLFSILFFILCLGNCGAPLTLNFIGEFLSLYGTFERQPVFGTLASSSIIFSAAYTIYMFNRTAFAGSYSKHFTVNIPDLNKREFYILLTLVAFTVILGVYPAPVLDGIHYSVTTLVFHSKFCELYMCIICLLHSRNNVYYNSLKINIIKICNLFKCELYLCNPPKPYAFVNLPLQSNIYVLPNLSVLDNLYLVSPRLAILFDIDNYIAVSCDASVPLAVSIVGVVFTTIGKAIIDLTGNEDQKEVPKLGFKVPNKEPDKVILDLVLVEDISDTGLPRTVLCDKNDLNANRSKDLYPGASIKKVDAVLGNNATKALCFQQSYYSRRNATSILFKDACYTVIDHGDLPTGAWIAKPSIARLATFGYEITTAGVSAPVHYNGKYIYVVKQ